MINFIKILGITAEVNTKILVLMLQYNGGGQEIFIFTCLLHAVKPKYTLLLHAVVRKGLRYMFICDLLR